MDRPKYRIEIFWSDEDGGYVANVPDLRYCSAFAESYEEALREVLVALELHLDTLQEAGRPIPEPRFSREAVMSTIVGDTGQAVEEAGATTEQVVEESARVFADAVRESYQALSDAERSASSQEINAQLTQDFFNGVINNLRTQAESNRALAEDLMEQQRKQQEASQALTQESVNAYTDFLNSMFSYYRDGLERSQKGNRN
jgi:predicted RNase H-like HicB family nuclease